MRSFVKLYRQFSTIQKATQNTGAVAKREYLQFSKKRLTDFGELPQGQIPEALEYDLHSTVSTLRNGVTIASESTTGPLASVQVLVKAGTRQESLESSGTSQFIKSLVTKGTASRNREQIQKELDGFGGTFDVRVSRETTTFTLSFLPQQLDQAVSFLGDVILNSSFNGAQIDAEREALYNQCVENVKDQSRTTLEAVHYTSFRDHYFGQPALGIRENIANVKDEHLRAFHAANYVGQNIVVAGAGNISHEALSAATERAFGSAPTQSSGQRANADKPYFTPSTLFMRDDELSNVNIGVFFEAPSYTDPDFFAAKVFQNVLGEYRADKYTGKHLNASDRQYSLIHTELGNMPDITLHKTEYLPYSDTGLFGSYLYGNEVFANQMLFLSQMVLTEYASYINPVEVFRAKNKIYNSLLEESNSYERVKDIAEQVAYLGRRIPRSEYARRISHYDSGLLSRAATRWFWDKELAVVAWGPIHGLMAYSHYNRPIRRSTLGWYGSQHYRIM